MNWFVARLLIALAALQVTALRGTISGMVIKAGTSIQQPLRNARLELTSGPGTPLIARTDANGRFSFSSLAAGEYRLAVTCDGFIRQESSKKIVLGRGQEAHAVFELEPAPTAAGWVLDSFGQPIPNIMVEALYRSYDVRGKPTLARAATAVTDDRGEYRVFWLDPGEYFFYAASALSDSAEESPKPVFTPLYFPGVNAPEDAKSVRLDIGREVRVDFRLLRRVALWGVSGHAMNALTGRPVGASIVLTPPAADPSLSRYRAQSSAAGLYPGEFSTAGAIVGPGTYLVSAKSGSGDQEISAMQRIVLRAIPYAPPPTSPPQYTFNISLSPPLSINGTLFIESRESFDLGNAAVTLISIDPDLTSPRSAAARADGRIVLNGVAPGTYVVEMSGLPADLYLKAARFGPNDILENPLALEARDASNPLQVLLGSDGGHLQVAAFNGKGEPFSGAQVVLVPNSPRRERREQYRLATSGEDGQVVLRGIPPGGYKVFAWEKLKPNGYLNSDYLRAYEDSGVPVTIISGDNPAVSVRTIPKE